MSAAGHSGQACGPDEGRVAASPSERRAAARSSVLRLWSLRVDGEAGAAPIAIRVRNLSPGGLMADCDHLFAAGERVAVDVRGIGLVRGTIAWSDEECVGIAFDRAINPLAARRPLGGGMMTSAITVARDGRRPPVA